MYFLTDVERKLLLGRILPQARKAGVSEELRGWNWSTPPLQPLYTNEGIPNYLVGSQYCSTARDVFVSRVRKIKGESNVHIRTGNLVHDAVSTVVLSHVEKNQQADFENWWLIKASDLEQIDLEFNSSSLAKEMGIKDFIRKVWDQTDSECKRAILARKAEQPHSTEHDVYASALPFLVEHKISGKLLGLSGLLSVDCYDYLHGVIFDLKYLRPGSIAEPWRKLNCAGYAIVLESVYETPLDIGCMIYISMVHGKLIVSRDLFFIGDDVRGWWLEERDKKLEIIAQKRDPGLPKKCYDACPYLKYCLGGDQE